MKIHIRAIFFLILGLVLFNACDNPKGPFLKISTTLEGQLFIDGQNMGIIKAGDENIKKIPLDSGEFAIVLKSKDAKDRIDTVFNMDRKDKVLHLDLKSKSDKRIAFENEINSIEKDMVLVEGGSFMMGCSPNDSLCEDDERPAHKVTLSSFKISKYELSVGQFKYFVEKSGYKTTAEKEGWAWVWNTNTDDWEKKEGLTWKTVSDGNKLNETDYNLPVRFVSWFDVQAFCEWLSKETGKKYRLPTESEWEFAARGGNKSKGYLYSGGNDIDKVAWFKNNSEGRVHAKGGKEPNELGLYDMSGNVWEWCEDWYVDYVKNEQVNKKELQNRKYRVLRGGSWIFNLQDCHVANRGGSTPDKRDVNFGFRLALVP